MPLPRGDEYQIAVQTPRRSFTDQELQASQVETTNLGLPKPYAGGFTTTYHFYNHTRHWAVRCFTRQVYDLHQRYRAIGRFIKKNNTRYFVPADCLLQGIRINGQWIPVIKMQWVEGQPLNIYLENNLGTPEKIRLAGEKFLKLVRTLEPLGIAHGDLQHGNILVKDDELYMIDYDGMYLPDLKRLSSNEIGHPNYQHPKRSDRDFDAAIDRFSAIVIYFGLMATAASPGLWEQFDDGENILFRKEDFLNPDHSPLLLALSKTPALDDMTRKFMGVCQMEYAQTPDLGQFIDGAFTCPKVVFSKFVTESPKPRYGMKPNYLEPVTAGQSGSGVSSPFHTSSRKFTRKEKEALDRLYSRGSSQRGANRRQTRPVLQTNPTVLHGLGSKQYSFYIPWQRRFQMSRLVASPWYRWMRAFSLLLGRFLAVIARGFAYLFLYNRPRQFTKESFLRLSLFLFYAVCAVAILLFLAWLANLLL